MEVARPQHARKSNLRVIINFTKNTKCLTSLRRIGRKGDQVVPSCNAQQTVAKQENLNQLQSFIATDSIEG
jgi:hypothetical protein